MRRRIGMVVLATLAVGGCDLDLTNPNSPPEEVVLTTPDGIIALANGMQGQYAGTGVGTGMVLNLARASGLVTDELGTTSRALAADRSLVTGTAVDASFGVVTSPFSTAFRVIRSAEELLESAPNVGLSQGTQAGVLATARTFKAMSLGALYLHYPRAPVTATTGSNAFLPREVVLDSAIALLEQARADLGSVTTADLADFRARVQGPGYDLGGVINAMLARYYLFDGQYAKAIEAADRVALNRLNVFTYPDPVRNPIWGYAYSLLYIGGTQEFVAEALPADMRPSYWLRTDQATFNGNPTVPLRNLRKYDDRNAPFPIFLPDEMRLIKAEAYARLGQFAEALPLINAVRTQQSSTLDEPVAGLPAITLDAVNTLEEALNEVAYQRRYELYLQGLRWEDTRRFGPAVAGETPSIQFFPLPQGECAYNPGANC